MKQFQCRDYVWVDCGMPAFHHDGSYIGRVVDDQLLDNTVLIETPDGGNKVVDTDNLRELVKAPIDEKNVISDWINDEMLYDCTQCGNQYLGWWHDNPVYCKIDNKGILHVHANADTIHEISLLISDLFDCCPENPIVSWRQLTPYGLCVAFYAIVE